MGAESDDICKVILRGLSELRDRKCAKSNEPADPPFIAKPSDGDSRILNPVAVLDKGRQPYQKKMSSFGATVKRKNLSGKT